MKRLCIGILVVALIICTILALKSPVQNPADYTGKWYCCTDGSAYLFHNGIIINEKHHVSTNGDEIFSGAYSFGKNRILLFFINSDGVEQVKELKLVNGVNGEKLCEISGNTENAVFCRNRETAKLMSGN